MPGKENAVLTFIFVLSAKKPEPCQSRSYALGGKAAYSYGTNAGDGRIL